MRRLWTGRGRSGQVEGFNEEPGNGEGFRSLSCDESLRSCVVNVGFVKDLNLAIAV